MVMRSRPSTAGPLRRPTSAFLMEEEVGGRDNVSSVRTRPCYALVAREVVPSQLAVGGGDVISLGNAGLDAARRPDDPENRRVGQRPPPGQRLRGAAKMTPCDCTGTMSTFPATPVMCHGALSFMLFEPASFLLHACGSHRETPGGDPFCARFKPIQAAANTRNRLHNSESLCTVSTACAREGPKAPAELRPEECTSCAHCFPLGSRKLVFRLCPGKPHTLRARKFRNACSCANVATPYALRN